MRRVILFLSVAVALAGCQSIASGPAGSDSSLIAGRLKISVSGVGTATNGADGTLYTDQAYAAALFIRNETSGRTYEVRTDTPGDLFLLANAEPGRYSLLELWAQVKTDNDYITIRSDFYKGPAFDVAPGHVANLGVNTWNFSYDLTRGVSTNGFSFNSDFGSVTDALSGLDVGPRWAGHAGDQTSFSGDLTAKASAIPLPPRGTSDHVILNP